MKSADVRRRYIDFFVKRGHLEIPSASIIPENDPTTLFTSSGMQPLVPYLLGQPHPLGTRLVNSQKCFRAQDIDEVGNSRYTTFFEMLGNWSLGDYFKAEQLAWVFEFLTKELGLETDKLYVTVFEGNEQISKDKEAIEIWKKIFSQAGVDFKEKERIFSYSAKDNWWSRSGLPGDMPPGEPGGPSSEIFYDFGEKLRTHENSRYKNEQCHPNCDCGRYLEIANSVFMQYQKKTDGSFKPLPQKNIDFGGGLERMTAATENQSDIFRTDLFWPIIQDIEKSSNWSYEDEINQPGMRVIADHLKAATFMAAEGLVPSNKQQGYVMRRLVRRAVLKMQQLDVSGLKLVPAICQSIVNIYPDSYLNNKKSYQLHSVIGEEVDKFLASLNKGIKLLQSHRSVDAQLVFDLHQSYGFPFEVTKEVLEQEGKKIDEAEYKKLVENHREKSRTAAKGMFKGGLADYSEAVTKLHTATHLLHAGLRKELGEHVKQTGSNITAQRLRFDFTHPQKLTAKQRQAVEDWVNQQIQQDLPISKKTVPFEQAQKEGALAFFSDQYGKQVDVYSIGDKKTGIVSQEVCGGPHVNQTGVLGRFVMGKEKAIGAGKRRIYGTL